MLIKGQSTVSKNGCLFFSVHEKPAREQMFTKSELNTEVNIKLNDAELAANKRVQDAVNAETLKTNEQIELVQEKELVLNGYKTKLNGYKTKEEEIIEDIHNKKETLTQEINDFKKRTSLLESLEKTCHTIFIKLNEKEQEVLEARQQLDVLEKLNADQQLQLDQKQEIEQKIATLEQEISDLNTKKEEQDKKFYEELDTWEAANHEKYYELVGRIETAKEKIIYLEEIETKLKAQPTQKSNN